MIYWDVLLGVSEEEVAFTLGRLYEEMSLVSLAEYLGVSRVALRQKLLACKIPLHKRGGSHPRFPRADLPRKAWQMDAHQLAALTGYTVNYCRKLKKQLRSDHEKE